MRLEAFFARRPVFRIDEITDFLGENGSVNPSTRDALLAHHVESGRILRIRRGLYAVVPVGTDASNLVVDPFLLAGKIVDDAVLAYHTALEAHGRAYSIFRRCTYLTRRNSGRAFEFQGVTYQGVSHPKAFQDPGRENLGIGIQDRAGLDIRITELERCLVDVLDRPNLSGTWEEIWRSLESIEYLKLDLVLEYAAVLGSATTAARVGFFLEQHRESLMVPEEVLDELERLRPRNPHYMEHKDRPGGRLLKRWNLIVPSAVLERAWEEM
jgi:predicted transcriptional regulator of viral defense system